MPPSIAEGIDKLFCHNLFLKSRVSKRYFLDDFTEFSDLNYQKMTLLIINQIIIITNSPLILLKTYPPKKILCPPPPLVVYIIIVTALKLDCKGHNST
jgi:hypothetical protein